MSKSRYKDTLLTLRARAQGYVEDEAKYLPNAELTALTSDPVLKYEGVARVTVLKALASEGRFTIGLIDSLKESKDSPITKPEGVE
jgi:hypothetical protein